MSNEALGGTVSVRTDVAMIVAFDPVNLKERVKEPRRWWYEAPMATPDRKAAKYALWPLGGRGGLFRVRVATELAEDEKSLDRGASPAAPLVVTSGEMFVGPVERMPCDGYGDRMMQIPDRGGLLPVPVGNWLLEAHVLDWRSEARFWNEDNEPTPDAPVDFVLLLKQAEGALPPPPAEVQPLLELLPQKKPKGSERVVHSTRPRAPIVLEVEKPAKRGGGGPREPREPREPKRPAGPTKVAPRKPGEIGEGSRVRHPTYGVGTVMFIRDGFPKAKVVFDDGEQKVEKDDLKALD